MLAEGSRCVWIPAEFPWGQAEQPAPVPGARGPGGTRRAVRRASGRAGGGARGRCDVSPNSTTGFQESVQAFRCAFVLDP